MVTNCDYCGTEYSITKSRLNRYTKHYCSADCKYADEKMFNPNIEEFKKDLWKQPITELAEIYGTSVKTIHKFCNKHKLDRPGRGWWQRVEAGLIDIDTHKPK